MNSLSSLNNTLSPALKTSGALADVTKIAAQYSALSAIQKYRDHASQLIANTALMDSSDVTHRTSARQILLSCQLNSLKTSSLDDSFFHSKTNKFQLPSPIKKRPQSSPGSVGKLQQALGSAPSLNFRTELLRPQSAHVRSKPSPVLDKKQDRQRMLLATYGCSHIDFSDVLPKPKQKLVPMLKTRPRSAKDRPHSARVRPLPLPPTHRCTKESIQDRKMVSSVENSPESNKVLLDASFVSNSETIIDNILPSKKDLLVPFSKSRNSKKSPKKKMFKKIIKSHESNSPLLARASNYTSFENSKKSSSFADRLTCYIQATEEDLRIQEIIGPNTAEKSTLLPVKALRPKKKKKKKKLESELPAAVAELVVPLDLEPSLMSPPKKLKKLKKIRTAKTATNNQEECSPLDILQNADKEDSSTIILEPPTIESIDCRQLKTKQLLSSNEAEKKEQRHFASMLSLQASLEELRCSKDAEMRKLQQQSDVYVQRIAELQQQMADMKKNVSTTDYRELWKMGNEEICTVKKEHCLNVSCLENEHANLQENKTTFQRKMTTSLAEKDVAANALEDKCSALALQVSSLQADMNMQYDAAKALAASSLSTFVAEKKILAEQCAATKQLLLETELSARNNLEKTLKLLEQEREKSILLQQHVQLLTYQLATVDDDTIRTAKNLPALFVKPQRVVVRAGDLSREEAAQMIQNLYLTSLARHRLHLMVLHIYEKHYDENTCEFFYVNTRTGLTSWKKPTLLGNQEVFTPSERQASVALQLTRAYTPPRELTTKDQAVLRIQGMFRSKRARTLMKKMIFQVFTKLFDTNSGLFFYFNTISGETSWDKPLLLGDDDLKEEGE